MSKVCLGACGLTTDTNGNLIVKTAGPWPYPGTPASSGDPIYCDPNTGGLFVPPPKYQILQFVDAMPGSGQLNTYGLTIGGGAGYITGPFAVTVANPSVERPMFLVVETRINRASVDIYDAGKTEFQIYPELTISGAITQAATAYGGRYTTATQHTAGDKFTDDGPGAENLPQFFTLPAGASATFSLRVLGQLLFFGGNATLSLAQAACVIKGWN